MDVDIKSMFYLMKSIDVKSRMLLLQESMLIKRSIGGLYGGFGVVLLVVVLTPSRLAMEYAAGGELFEQICDIERFSKVMMVGFASVILK
ncbi:conserved hypothetical protein [Ricinus communis]|uniref:Uncharacterized protein n=1 Tax=Ricinus communis TaxID=3988 RepID=B9RVJ2_RICCO|nr:conserved hypothetical protein [Ricinus communis]